MLPSLLVLASAALPPAWQDPAPPAPATAPIKADPNDPRPPLPLRIEDVVTFVLTQAPAVRQAQLAALANAGSVQQQEGTFDPVVYADATYSYSEIPNAGGFIAGGVDSTKVKRAEANQGIRSLLMTGGSVDVSLNEAYIKDNLPSSFFGLNPESSVVGNVNLTQPLLRGGWEPTATFNLRAAELAYDQGVADLKATMNQNLQAAVDAYWNLVFALKDREVKRISLERAEELKEITLARFRVGAAAEVEVVQTESEIAARTVELITARNVVLRAEDTLRILILSMQEREDWEYQIVPVSDPPTAVYRELDWMAAWETARDYRPELRSLRLEVEQSRLAWEVAQDNLAPRLDLVASGTTRGLSRNVDIAWQDATGFRSHGYSFGVLFEVPIGNNQFQGAERRARVLYQLAQRNLRDQENLVANEVRDAVRNVKFVAEQVVATKRARVAAQRQLDAEMRRLQEGASTNFEVLTFQVDLQTAESNHALSLTEYGKALIRLRTVQGLNYDGSPPEGYLEPTPADLPDRTTKEILEEAIDDPPNAYADTPEVTVPRTSEVFGPLPTPEDAEEAPPREPPAEEDGGDSDEE